MQQEMGVTQRVLNMLVKYLSEEIKEILKNYLNIHSQMMKQDRSDNRYRMDKMREKSDYIENKLEREI